MEGGRALAFFLLFCFFQVPLVFGEASYSVGYRDLQQPFVGRIWYPTDDSIREEPIPTSSLFETFSGGKEAPLIASPRKLPLLLLAHGSGGTFERLDWIADYFVRKGWITAAMNYPGNTLGDNSAGGLIQIWKRTKYTSKFLNYLWQESFLKGRIDKKRIAIVGHSVGGTTALLLGGARLARGRFQNPIPFCQPLPQEYDDEDCRGLKTYNYQQHSRKEIESSYRDKRIRAIVALDPAFARSFQSKALKVPALFLAAEKVRDSAGEIFSKEFREIFPKAEHEVIPDSIHISFVSPCSPFGFKIKAPICFGDGIKRSEIHRSANLKIEAFLRSVP